MSWALLWSSEDVRYCGSGVYSPATDGPWRLPGHAAIVMRPSEREAIDA
jgi:maltooligosyltrehalose trehalohydrolase